MAGGTRKLIRTNPHMAQNTNISWCDHTMNFWIGCAKVSDGCKNCYAEVDTFARTQRARGRELWGLQADRHITSAANWRKPFTWNKNEWWECANCGWRGSVKENASPLCQSCKTDNLNPTRQRVFCQSLSDICEDHPQIQPIWRASIAQMVRQCSNIDFLFLTKRPRNFNRLWLGFFDGVLPDNLWVGATVENQETAEKRIPELIQISAKTRFLSCEPLLGPVNLGLIGTVPKDVSPIFMPLLNFIHWVIVGGESGRHARPMLPQWVRSIRYQCENAAIPFHFKQFGEYNAEGRKVGKKNSGRLLDGIEHNEFPIGNHA